MPNATTTINSVKIQAGFNRSNRPVTHSMPTTGKARTVTAFNRKAARRWQWAISVKARAVPQPDAVVMMVGMLQLP